MCKRGRNGCHCCCLSPPPIIEKIRHLMEVKPFGTSYFNNVILYFSGFSLNLLTTLVIICVDYDRRSMKFTLFYNLL
jgi:hypothetical protein